VPHNEKNMKLVYLTSNRLPSKRSSLGKVILEMSKSFTDLLGNDFLLIMAKAQGPLEGIEYKSLRLPFKKGVSLYYFFWLFGFIIKNRKEQLIFFGNDFYLLAIVCFLKKWLPCRVCSDWHLMYDDWRDNYVARRSDWLTTTSQRLKNIIARRTMVNPDKIFVERIGVDIDKFKNFPKNQARRELELPADKKLIGYIGSFTAVNHDRELKIMIDMLDFLPQNIMTILVGAKNNEKNDYEEYAKQKGAADRFQIFDWQTEEDKVLKFEQAMDILVVPYPNKKHFTDYGFPYKVYEYMAGGVPIIYSDLEIIGEMLGDCAVSFIPENAKDLAEKIIDLLNDENKIKYLTKIAREKASNSTWRKQAENIIEFLTKDDNLKPSQNQQQEEVKKRLKSLGYFDE